MSRFVTYMGMVVGLILLLGSSVQAQVLKVDVPFAFSTPNTELPAGAYEFQRVNSGTSNTYFLLRHESGSQNLVVAPMLLQRPESGSQGAMLRFNCVGDSCALSGIFDRPNLHGAEVLLSRKRARTKTMADSRVVMIAAR